MKGLTTWPMIGFVFVSGVCHGVSGLSLLIYNEDLVSRAKGGSLYVGSTLLIFLDFLFCLFLRKDSNTEDDDDFDDENSMSSSMLSESEVSETPEEIRRREENAEKLKTLLRSQEKAGPSTKPAFISEKMLLSIRSVDVLVDSDPKFFRFVVYDGSTAQLVLSRNFKEFANFYSDVANSKINEATLAFSAFKEADEREIPFGNVRRHRNCPFANK